jgi:hypothetical protein
MNIAQKIWFDYYKTFNADKKYKKYDKFLYDYLVKNSNSDKRRTK